MIKINIETVVVVIIIFLMVVFAISIAYQADIGRKFCYEKGYDNIEMSSGLWISILNTFNCEGVDSNGFKVYSNYYDYNYAKNYLKNKTT